MPPYDPTHDYLELKESIRESFQMFLSYRFLIEKEYPGLNDLVTCKNEALKKVFP
jgi:hypothetical protein